MPVEKNTVAISIYGHSIRALVDTGASISCVSSDLIPKLGINPSQLSPSNVRDAVAVGGERHASLGAISLPISFDGPLISHTFHVFQSFNHPLILGLDFLNQNDGIFNAENCTLYLRDPDDNTAFSIDTNTGFARVLNTTSIPPNSVVSVQVFITNIPKHKTVLLEPCAQLPQCSLAGAKCLVENTGKAFMQIINPSNKPIRLNATTPIASASIVNEKTIYSLDTPLTISKQNTNSQSKDPIHFDLQHTSLSDVEKDLLTSFLSKHRAVFATDLHELGEAKTQPHRIDTGDAHPIRQRFYRQSPHVNAEMNRQIEEMLSTGIIEESSSMWQSPVVMVKKKNGQLRFAVDYRKLNAVTKQFTFPLPRLEDVFDTIGSSQAKLFSTLDLASGFWQIPMDSDTKHKSAFVTPSGVYQWKRMPFGLVNAPASFQALMTQVLRGLNWKTCLVYVDDILVFSNSFKEHLQHLEQIFTRLTEAGLTLKPSKCAFALSSVKYLGHVLTKDGVQVDVSKTDTVRSFPIPRNQKELRSFLGLCNYYRKFVKGYSRITNPLTALLCKDTPFTWTEECQSAFDKLRTALTTSPVLAYPDHNKPFTLTTDASGSAIGYILGQTDSTGIERVIAYGGRSLNQHERKYPVSEKEGLAIVEGIKTYHVYLASQPFKIFTDHAALKWLNNVKHSTGRLARWAVLLQGYKYEIHYKPGKKNEVADALSRRPYPETSESLPESEDVIPSADVSSLESNKVFYETTFFYKRSEDSIVSETTSHTACVCAIDTNPSIAELQQDCPDFGPMYKYFKNDELPSEKSNREKLLSESNFYVFLDNVLYHYYQPRSKRARHPDNYVKQLAVPRCLREDVLRSYHDSLAGGAHFGFERTYRAIQLKYYWPGMYQNVADYVRSCDQCQCAKKSTQNTHAPLVNMPVTKPFNRIHMDILGPVTKTSKGHKYILLVVDSFSIWPEAFPLKTQDSKEIATVLFREIFARYGAPRTLITDRGQNFMSKLVTAVCELFQVTRHHTSSYHPQTNAACERMNSTIAQCIRTYINEDQDNWTELLPGILMALRMSPSTQSSDLSPHQILFGSEMELPFDTSVIPKDGMNQDAKTHVENLIKHLKVVENIATDNIRNAQQRQKAQYDKTAVNKEFRVGEWVLLHNTKVRKGLSPKFTKPWDGPFYIARQGSNNTYKIIRCSNNKALKSHIHANRLKPYNNPAHRQHLDPPPDAEIIDDTHLPPDNYANEQHVNPNPNNIQDATANNDATQPLQAPGDQPPTPTQPNNSGAPNPVPPDAPQGKNSSQPPSSQPEIHPPDALTGEDTQPTPSQTSDDNIGYVEKLIRYRYQKGKKYFLVKWIGYREKTWEPEDNINPALIQKYLIDKTQTGQARKRKKRSCFN